MNTDKIKVFAAGNPLLDISVHTEASMIEKYELMYGGAVLAEPKHEELFKELMAMPGMETIPGGSALNTIRCTNFMLSAAGQERACLYFGSIGKDIEVGK